MTGLHCINRAKNLWQLIWGCQEVQDEESEDVSYEYNEVVFDHKPTLQEIKDVILGEIDTQTDAKILCGYEWTVLHGPDEGKTVKVWLSDENQRNFKAMHDAAVMYPQEADWPIEYKVSETEDKTPINEYFDNIQELAAFYLGGIGYIDRCLKEGWQRKDAIDWEPYKALLQDIGPTPSEQ